MTTSILYFFRKRLDFYYKILYKEDEPGMGGKDNVMERYEIKLTNANAVLIAGWALFAMVLVTVILAAAI